MSDLMTNTPVVMSITDLDPSGGGGISAAVETLSSLGCHCTPVLSRLAACDTHSPKNTEVIDSSLLIEQIRAILEDIRVDLLYVDNITSISHAEAIHTILSDYPRIPLVLYLKLDVVDHKSSLSDAIRALLIPQAKLVITNKHEAMALAPGADTLAACSQELMELGCNNILVTNTNGHGNRICNHWFSRHGSSQQYQWERLPGRFLGSSNTLVAAISAYLAHGLSMAESIQQAQQFTWQALNKAKRIGMGDLLPDRLHWSKR